MDLAALALLVDTEGWDLLASLPAYDARSELSLQTRLRDAGYAPELVAAALLQTQLRARAKDKFGTFADGMLFTPDGLEQATRFAVAARHAARYLRAEVRLVHDLGCGIGADAMAFAGLDLAVRAVDADAVTATVAGVNLRHWPAAQVVHGRAEDVGLPTGEDATHTGVWVDPARRLGGPADARGRSPPGPLAGPDLADLGAGPGVCGAGAGHGGEAGAVVPACGRPGGRRGAVGVVAG